MHATFHFLGKIFTFSLGNLQVLYVSDPNVVKEITTMTSQDLGRPSYQQKTFGPLLGQGILTSNGAIWARQRKIMAPELFMEKVRVRKWYHDSLSQGSFCMNFGY